MKGAKRKKEHVEICLAEEVQSVYNYWDDVRLVHQALPELDKDEIDISLELFGKRLNAPIIISGMTGGFKGSEKINENLANAASALGLGLGIGSQRQALEEESLAHTFAVVKRFDVPLVIANIGAPQLIEQSDSPAFTIGDVKVAMDMVGADVLAVHLNYTQEMCQPEGQTRARNCFEAIGNIAQALPIIAKETGGGITREVALRLKAKFVAGIDVGGLGGTSFAAIEHYRARNSGEKFKQRLAKSLWNWGIPAPASVVEANVGIPLIATGGIRTGVDIAKALVLGARCAGIALPLLGPATKSADLVRQELESFIEELKAAMFLMGAKNLDAIRRANAVLEGSTASWLNARGFDVQAYSRKSQR